MDTLILDATGEDFGKHAYSQLAEFSTDAEVKEIKLVDVPGKISRSDADTFMVIIDMEEELAETVVDKVLDLEIRNGMMEKVLLESEGESREVFKRRARRKAGEAAEKLGKKHG